MTYIKEQKNNKWNPRMLKVFDGTKWKQAVLKEYDGSSWNIIFGVNNIFPFELSIDQDENNIILDIISAKEYYFEIGWQKNTDGTIWSDSEFTLFKTNNFTKYIDKYDYFETGDVCTVRVRAKDIHNFVGDWTTTNILVN